MLDCYLLSCFVFTVWLKVSAISISGFLDNWSDAGVGRNTSAGKENGINQTSDRTGLISLPPVAQDANSEDVGR